jgi:ribonuclease HI
MIGKKNKKQVEIYTDGACSGNPGMGGWAAVLLYKQHKKEICGAEDNTTNNRMELTAIIKGLELLKEPCAVTLYSDSAYSLNPFLNGWLENWQSNGWRTGGNEDVKNVDLWQALVTLTRKHQVKFVKVKGHADNVLNNRCDELARGAIVALRQNKTP